MFDGEVQGSTAGGQDLEGGTGGEQPRCQSRDKAAHVLAVVEDQQQLSGVTEGGEPLLQIDTALGANAQ
jgi:hypothetical protein